MQSPPPSAPETSTTGQPPVAEPGRSIAHRPFWRRRPTIPDLVAGVVFAVAGALFVASGVTSFAGDIRKDTTGGLRAAISERAQYAQTLAGEVDGLQLRMESLRAMGDPGPALIRTEEQIADLAPAVGLTEVTGPGVTVELNDAPIPDPMPDDTTGDDYIVHQQDVQGVVNAMWRAGASGVTVMGQRIINTSAVRCVGNTVILQGRVYSPPFVITAVGNVAAIEFELERDPTVQSFRDWSQIVGLGYQQQSFLSATLPAYTGPLNLDYAKVPEARD